MTRYQSPVRETLLFARNRWPIIEGLRFVSDDGEWQHGFRLCTFDDDNASPELEGKIVAPSIWVNDNGTASVANRLVIE